MEEVVCIRIVCVVFSAVLSLGAAWEQLGFLSVTGTGVATLVGTLPPAVPHGLGVIFTVPLCESESDNYHKRYNIYRY